MLVGYMASGKSSIGKALSEALNIDFIDLDEAIETSEKMTISELFASKGEIYFRKKESETLSHILKQESFVLSTGGGTPCYGRNMEDILNGASHSFYLKLSISSLVERIANESDKRPLVKDLSKEELPEFIGKHLFERSFFYSQARQTIVCDGKLIDEIVAEIKRKLI